jgi:hypothetical protein
VYRDGGDYWTHRKYSRGGIVMQCVFRAELDIPRWRMTGFKSDLTGWTYTVVLRRTYIVHRLGGGRSL